jgi:hypothetical protein
MEQRDPLLARQFGSLGFDLRGKRDDLGVLGLRGDGRS